MSEESFRKMMVEELGTDDVMVLYERFRRMRETLVWIKGNHHTNHSDCAVCMAVDVCLEKVGVR